MKIASKFASELLKSRKKYGLTQSEVAEAVSISVRWYQKIESGRKMPSATLTLRLVAYLELDVQNLRQELGLSETSNVARANVVNSYKA